MAGTGYCLVSPIVPEEPLAAAGKKRYRAFCSCDVIAVAPAFETNAHGQPRSRTACRRGRARGDGSTGFPNEQQVTQA